MLNIIKIEHQDYEIFQIKLARELTKNPNLEIYIDSYNLLGIHYWAAILIDRSGFDSV